MSAGPAGFFRTQLPSGHTDPVGSPADGRSRGL